MSRDFIRQMPMAGDGIGYRQRVFNWFNLDPMLLCILLAIAGFGLLVLYSAADASEAVIRAQGVRLMAGFGLMLVIAQIPPYVLARITPVLYLFGLILLILTYPFGYEVNGSKRWLRIPGLINLQPSELMKVFLPMVMAWYLNERHLPPAAKPLTIGLGLMLLPFSLILLQPDLGTALLVASSGALVLLLAGLSWRFLFRLLLLVVAAAPAIWFLIRDYQRQRILTLFDPESDPLGAGWNIIQSKIAIGSGGLTGKGLFNGTQSHLDFLPETQTDFIVAVLAEELGFVGVVSLLSLYGLLMFRGLLISLQAQDTYGRLLAGSITFTFVVYVFVNIGMVSGILPVVGIPLPLVSYGGSSILTLFAGFGILMSIHSHRRINV
ncbi:MAG: rod shape-determining protein RodA [Gammaproteobacteria bacterium TMED95]|jgi:rod shape determining protein RodA|nr:rod shape-determining protein RodA [Gammaproteobacteria bacterium]OUV22735.1 MAG: rod shape-determining protein RodA [Gammaproteobacteria bacterium TMED95]|tara:strand:+ start:43 stop:1182 length:1140 start_codon:yes stop_codon:yes gene_type:complete